MRTFDNIPKGWEAKLIPNVLFFQEGPGVRKWQFTDEGVKLLNVGNINNQKINLSVTKVHISDDEAYGKYSHFLIDEGDLLIACSGIVVNNFHNKIAFVSKEHLPLCLNTSTMRFKALDETSIDLNYFSYFLQTKYFTKQLQKYITGSAQLNFGPSHIKKIEVLLPPLPQQKKIAAILDTANTYRQKTKALIAKYDELKQSLFFDMFGDPVLNPKGWKTKELKEVALVNSGFTKGRKFKEELSIGERPYMRVANVQDGYLDLREVKKIPAIKSDLDKFLLMKGDVLLTEGGDPDKLGRGAVWNEEIKGCLHQNHIFKVRLNKEILKPIYFSKLTGSIYGKRYFLKFGKQTTGIATINKTQLTKFPVLIPPLALQTQFAKRVQAIDKQKEQAQASLTKAEDLFNCLLQKAFKGELV